MRSLPAAAVWQRVGEPAWVKPVQVHVQRQTLPKRLQELSVRLPAFVVAMAVLKVIAVALQVVASWIHRGSGGEDVAERHPRVGTAG